MTGSLVPQGGGTLGAAEWLEVIEADYLRDFLPVGGAAVKFAVPGSGETAEQLASGLRTAATTAGLVTAEVDAAATRLHMVDQVYAAVSSQLDWRGIARGWLSRAYGDLGLEGASALAVLTVAEQADLDARELQRTLRRRLEQTLLADVALPRDLRTAVLRVAQGEAAFPETRVEDTNVALRWLRGEAVPAAALRRLGLSARVGRGSARALLVALGRVLSGGATPGLGGLVVLLRAERLAVSRRPPLEERDGIYYSRAAVLDAWEVLRQLIDATEQMAGMLTVVVIPPELVTDEARGLPSYSALALRVADEVRDRRRANPFAALVRLDVRLEAVR